MKQDSTRRLAALILAGGGSSRLGQPKQLVEYNGVQLVRLAAQAALDAGAHPVVVVTGSSADEVSFALEGMAGVDTCFNENWARGLSSSLTAGIRCIEQDPDVDGILVTLADQPHVTAGTLAELVTSFDTTHRLAAAAYNGVIGVPAVFGREFFSELSELTGDQGAGKWLRARENQVRSVPMKEASFDVDAPKDVAKLKVKSPAFRWRGKEIARIEALSDAVFGFAVTLLVVSLEVPRTFSALQHEMRGFFAFAICFALLILIWHEQHTFFRRYGLQDTKTTLLNCVLLFVVLFYVYPLKFMFTMLVNRILGGPREIEVAQGVMEPVIATRDLPTLMIIFGVGYMAVFLLFAAMYFRAYKAREELSLTQLEVFDTRESVLSSLISAGVALASILVATWAMLAGHPQRAGLAGMMYPLLIAPSMTIFYTIMGVRRRKIEASL